MEKRSIHNSDLVRTTDSRIYHLYLKPEDIAEPIFLVGDPGRVKLMSSLFDEVVTRIENREFMTDYQSHVMQLLKNILHSILKYD